MDVVKWMGPWTNLRRKMTEKTRDVDVGLEISSCSPVGSKVHGVKQGWTTRRPSRLVRFHSQDGFEHLRKCVVAFAAAAIVRAICEI